jgi:hypothetical protein
MYLVSLSPITNIELYSISIKGSLDFRSLIIKFSIIINYTLLGRLVVYSKL